MGNVIRANKSTRRVRVWLKTVLASLLYRSLTLDSVGSGVRSRVGLAAHLLFDCYVRTRRGGRSPGVLEDLQSLVTSKNAYADLPKNHRPKVELRRNGVLAIAKDAL